MSETVRRVLGLILAAGLLGSLGYYLVRPGSERHAPTKANIGGVCLECKQSAQLSVGLREIPPHECPRCHKSALYPVFFCYDCHKLFVPKLTIAAGDPLPRLPLFPACLLCGGLRTGGRSATDPAQQSGEVALPDWPPKG